MTDPSTYWLTITNIALGAMVAVCCGAVAFGIWQEFAARRKKAAELSRLDREVAGLFSAPDGHAFHVPGLGFTMADGGEKTGEKEDER